MVTDANIHILVVRIVTHSQLPRRYIIHPTERIVLNRRQPNSCGDSRRKSASEMQKRWKTWDQIHLVIYLGMYICKTHERVEGELKAQDISLVGLERGRRRAQPWLGVVVFSQLSPGGCRRGMIG